MTFKQRARILKQSTREGFRPQWAVFMTVCTVFLIYLFGVVGSDRLSAWEATNYPVLDYVRQCDGQWQHELTNPNGTTTALPVPICQGNMTTYDPFMQENTYCDGQDAVVNGYLSKVRPDARYVVGAQRFYYGSPFGRFQMIPFQWDRSKPDSDFLDVPAGPDSNRPLGIQDWGPWRLRGGCDPKRRYDTWYTTVQHEVVHPFWTLKTVAGPFPLPALPQ